MIHIIIDGDLTFIPGDEHYVVPNTFPPRYLREEVYHENQTIEMECPRCKHSYKIKAGLWYKLWCTQDEVVCYRCKVRRENYNKVKAKANEYAKTARYISGQRPFLDEE